LIIFKHGFNCKETTCLCLKKIRKVSQSRRKILQQNIQSFLARFVINLKLYKKWKNIIIIVKWHLNAETAMIFSQLQSCMSIIEFARENKILEDNKMQTEPLLLTK